jgi:hypothetical protein
MSSGPEPAATTTATPPPAAPAAIPLRSWQWGLGPQLIGLFLLITAFDRLGPFTLARAGLIPSILAALLGGLLAYGLLFLPAASWGVRTRGAPLDLAAGAFGTAGARAVAAVVFGLAQTVWFATALGYAAELTLGSFAGMGLLEPDVIDGLGAGAATAGTALRGPVYLMTTLLWMASALAVGRLLWPIVAAVLYAYQPFPALALGGLMLWALGGIAAGGWPGPSRNQTGAGMRLMVQLVFAYAASAGVLAADWGAGSRDRRDVRLGGLVGLGLAPAVVVSVAFVTVLGGLARLEAPPSGPEAYVYTDVLLKALPRPLGGVAVLVFTLALLGPVCYASVLAGKAFAAAWPFLPRWLPPLFVAALAWPLAAFGLTHRLELMFGLAGGPVAALLGVIAARLLVSRRSAGAGDGDAPPPAFRPLGGIAWALGAVVGLAPYLGPPAATALHPAAVAAWAVAFGVAALGWALAPSRPAPAAPGQAAAERA